MAKKNQSKPVDETPDTTPAPAVGQDDTAPVDGGVVVTTPVVDAPAVAEGSATTQATPDSGGDAAAPSDPAPVAESPLPEPSFDLDPASLKTVNAVLPHGVEVPGYRKREFRIGIEESEAINKLWGGLQAHNARLPDGRSIETPDHALSWLLLTYLKSA